MTIQQLIGTKLGTLVNTAYERFGYSSSYQLQLRLLW